MKLSLIYDHIISEASHHGADRLDKRVQELSKHYKGITNSDIPIAAFNNLAAEMLLDPPHTYFVELLPRFNEIVLEKPLHTFNSNKVQFSKVKIGDYIDYRGQRYEKVSARDIMPASKSEPKDSLSNVPIADNAMVNVYDSRNTYPIPQTEAQANKLPTFKDLRVDGGEITAGNVLAAVMTPKEGEKYLWTLTVSLRRTPDLFSAASNIKITDHSKRLGGELKWVSYEELQSKITEALSGTTRWGPLTPELVSGDTQIGQSLRSQMDKWLSSLMRDDNKIDNFAYLSYQDKIKLYIIHLHLLYTRKRA